MQKDVRAGERMVIAKKQASSVCKGFKTGVTGLPRDATDQSGQNRAAMKMAIPKMISPESVSRSGPSFGVCTLGSKVISN